MAFLRPQLSYLHYHMWNHFLSGSDTQSRNQSWLCTLLFACTCLNIRQRFSSALWIKYRFGIAQQMGSGMQLLFNEHLRRTVAYTQSRSKQVHNLLLIGMTLKGVACFYDTRRDPEQQCFTLGFSPFLNMLIKKYHGWCQVQQDWRLSQKYHFYLTTG